MRQSTVVMCAQSYLHLMVETETVVKYINKSLSVHNLLEYCIERRGTTVLLHFACSIVSYSKNCSRLIVNIEPLWMMVHFVSLYSHSRHETKGLKYTKYMIKY